ncbi:MAG TPA: VanZ family protein [Flavobacterium sp.]|nr:VanZ family protein [Flavobacterium sp.]
MGNKTYFWIASLWTLIIAVLCLVSFTDFPKTNVHNVDKYVHVTFHFFFTLFWYLHFRNKFQERNPLRLSFGILLISIVYGIAIELAQEFFTTTREADIKDVAANFAGAVLAALILMAYRKYKEIPKT